MLGLDATDVRNLLSVYNACYHANDKNADLNDFMTGMRSSLQNRTNSLNFLRTSLLTTLGELQQAMGQIDIKE